jgi:hypothetical protein
MRHSVFTLEVCARIDLGSLFDQLAPLLRNAPERLSRQAAWQRHGRAATIVLGALDKVERGCWEYFDDERTAMSMFEDWCRPLVERDLPRREPSGAITYRDTAPRYLALTFVYLLAYGSPSDLQLRRTCSVRNADLWGRPTFRRLLEAVRALSFASVKADAMYMVPRDHDWALTAEDLAAERFRYLRVLRG